MNDRRGRRNAFLLGVIAVILTWGTCLAAGGTAMETGGSEFSAHGYNVIRVENEYKLSVPDELTEKVWQYLQTRYDNSNLFLMDYDPAFSTAFADEHFIDRYFDDSKLTLLNNESGIRHRTRLVNSDAGNRKNGRELVQIKLKRPEDEDINRSEIKFPVKHYDKAEDLLDAHPLIGLIKREKREEFVDRVLEVGIIPGELRNSVSLDQRRRRVYVSLASEPFATITLDRVQAEKWGKQVGFTEVEMELNEIAYTEGDTRQQARMQEINDHIKRDLLEVFPAIRQDQTPKYNKVYNAFNRQFLFFPLALEMDFPMEYLLVGAAICLLIGLGAFLKSRWQARGKAAARQNT